MAKSCAQWTGKRVGYFILSQGRQHPSWEFFFLSSLFFSQIIIDGFCQTMETRQNQSRGASESMSPRLEAEHIKLHKEEEEETT
jgi:hypothetical protein